VSLPNVPLFENFGKLRNGIQHFAPDPGPDSADQTLRFVFGVIDPFINECWGLFAIDFEEELNEPYAYLIEALVRRQILFLVSPRAAIEFDSWDVDWKRVSKKYRHEMHLRAGKTCK